MPTPLSPGAIVAESDPFDATVTAARMNPTPASVPAFTCTAPVPVAEPAVLSTTKVPPLIVIAADIVIPGPSK